MSGTKRRCLLHQGVILLVYICACALLKRGTSLPDGFFLFYNAAILALSAAFARRDFGENLFRIKWTAANVLRQVGTALAAAILFTLFVTGVAMLFEDVSLLPKAQTPPEARELLFTLLLQLVIALAEEAYFNYYLYDTLMLFDWQALWSSIITACLFASMHWILNGSMKQLLIAFAFRLAALLLRKVYRAENAFYACAGMHLLYNLMVFFVVSI